MLRSIMLFLGFCALNAPAAGAFAADDLIYFQAGLDANTEDRLNHPPAAPAVSQGARLAPDAGGPASAGARVEYDLGADFPDPAGSLELRLRPEAAPAAPGEFMRVQSRAAGKDGFSIALAYAPNGQRWYFQVQGRGGQCELAAWHGAVKPGQWNHLLLTWDRADEQACALYLNGAWLMSQPFTGRLAGPAALAIALTNDTAVKLGHLAVYRRALSKSQAQLLAQLSTQAVDRIAGLAERIRQDDRAAEERRALVARLQGKVGRVYHNRGMTAGPAPMPEGVLAEGIRPEDLGKIDLARFAVIYFPLGPNFQITPDQYPAIRKFVEDGGGYVGDCQGAYFAEKIKILPITCYYNNIWGLYKIALKPHFVTDYRREEITMHFGNGPIMVAGEGCQVLATYAMTLPGGLTPASIVAGRYGKGTVVIFGTHPTGEKVAFMGTRAHFSGKLLGTERMLVNALLLAAGLVDESGAPRP